jgi:hypothetical protein
MSAPRVSWMCTASCLDDCMAFEMQTSHYELWREGLVPENWNVSDILVSGPDIQRYKADLPPLS